MDLSHTENSPRLRSWHNGKWQSLFHFLVRARRYTPTDTQPPTPHPKDTRTHFLCPRPSSSAFLPFTLFYISVTSAFLLCSSCQLSFHALPQKCVQVNISRLLMLKGSGSGRYVTGRELSVPRAAADKPEPLFFPRCFYIPNNGYA